MWVPQLFPDVSLTFATPAGEIVCAHCKRAVASFLSEGNPMLGLRAARNATIVAVVAGIVPVIALAQEEKKSIPAQSMTGMAPAKKTDSAQPAIQGGQHVAARDGGEGTGHPVWCLQAGKSSPARWRRPRLGAQPASGVRPAARWRTPAH